uniref:Pentatricopeptide repeat protein n=1 Tax=Physcomitrium patens TaxID=3218 RepID=A0A7I4BAB5_PHYPA|nr:pentatricopeptide repeat-containing protein At1g11290, chloroplastic-like isoform X2 [Physcomitrium patens]|eukprot:XP_024401449.1 pentatricopeptide repeat-containing protein At1g11290, chloroplastic-like isoform X2 [Physcomitrella patens]
MWLAGMAVNSTSQLFKSLLVTSELIDGQNRGRLASSSLYDICTRVHDCILKSGMDQNPYVANKLMRVYIRCGKVQDARHVFDKLVKKNVFNWTTMIGGYAEHGRPADAIEVYNQMRQEGGRPNEVTYLSILKACACPVGLKWGKEIHAHISHGGFRSDVPVQTALVNMYAKSGSIKDARLVFDEMAERNVITWNVMIGGLAQHGFGQEAFSLFLQMQEEGFVPDSTTYLSILTATACSSAGALGWVKEVHRHAVKAGFDSDMRVCNALVHVYSKSGSVDDARLVFEGMLDRDVISWSAMIGGLAQNGCGHEAFSLFLKMQREGVIPNVTTYVSILTASASAGALEWVKQVHNHARKAGLGSDFRVCNALVHMYAKSGSIDDARLVFDQMSVRNVFTWNAMIGGLAQHGCGQEAFSLFLRMRREGVVPDAITYMSILNASASTGALGWVKEVHRQAVQAGLDSDVRVGNALVHMYCKTGSISDARLMFDGMVERDVITWTAMISGLAQNECGQEAFSLFLQMQREGFIPVATTYASILNVCTSTGLAMVEEI